MQTPDAHERLRQLALASMPTQNPVCILCEQSPHYIGVGRIDGIPMAYCLCEACVKIDYVPAVTAKIRTWRFSRQRN